MKSLIVLWKYIAEESAMWCCTSTSRDGKTVEARTKHEGLSFLTITLPAFGKDFERGLDRGKVDHSLFCGSFRKRGELPLFLGGFLDRVFDRSSGVLLDEPCVDSIRAVRQLSLMFSKILLPCSDARIRKSIDGFIKCEQDVRRTDASMSAADLADFHRVSTLLFGTMLRDIDRDIYYLADNIMPKHGPGSTADRLSGNRKYEQTQWTARLEKIFPCGEFLIPNWRYYDNLDEIDILEPGDEIPMRVITVPKTLKTPRIIGIEPTAMQYMQQAILPLITESIGRDDFLSKIIGFDDQAPNQRMAMEGSLSQETATLDLSEASDRVSNQLVREMLKHYGHLAMAVDAVRSRKADVPGHGVIRLAKFAPMGSALCFPFEAMVFATMIFIGIERELNTPLDHGTIQKFRDSVRVYGDDIIVPVDTVRSVVESLQTFGSVVNLGKSFWTGKFRESCGKEYYDGHDVSIVRVRNTFPTHRRHATELISLISLRNQMYTSGYWQTTRWLDEEIRKVIRYFPDVLPSSPVQGRWSFLGYQAERYHPYYHSPLVKGYVVSSTIPRDALDGEGALLKFFLKRGRKPSADERHLERAGRPKAVNIKPGWYSPY